MPIQFPSPLSALTSAKQLNRTAAAAAFVNDRPSVRRSSLDAQLNRAEVNWSLPWLLPPSFPPPSVSSAPFQFRRAVALRGGRLEGDWPGAPASGRALDLSGARARWRGFQRAF